MLHLDCILIVHRDSLYWSLREFPVYNTISTKKHTSNKYIKTYPGGIANYWCTSAKMKVINMQSRSSSICAKAGELHIRYINKVAAEIIELNMKYK